jgi:UDP-N-acetylmuramate: L-alanyl-gamma-D-glutamyl-meso-diaminopimelate ligase
MKPGNGQAAGQGRVKVVRELGWIHFIAVGGTGMGSLAGLVAARGIRVTGSDQGLYPPMSTALFEWGIPIVEGFSPANLEAEGAARPDLVVIGNAVRPENPEARAAIDGGLVYLSFSDALYQLAIQGKHSIVISGTHGKTTTTNLTACLLAAAGRDPSLLVGGISLDFGGSFRDGHGQHFVVEGDEYDTAFFDKTPKFLHYHPQTLVVTSVEFDHADIYRDLDHVKSAFRELLAQMPEDGLVVAACDHAGVREVVAEAPCKVLRYGLDDPAATADGDDGSRGRPHWLARELRADARGTSFELVVEGRGSFAARIPLHGRVNVENALAALAVADAVGVPPAESLPALPEIKGVKRRQEVRGEADGVTVIDDFAHHPTAVCASIEALRARYAGHRLVVAFEPRTNTSRRRIFQDDYARAFDGADEVLVFRTPEAPIYSATGQVTEFFSADELVRALRARGLPAWAFGEVDEIVAHVAREHRPGDVVAVMSNGSFGNIWEKLLRAL